MNYRRLGSTVLKVLEIPLGSWTTYAGHAGAFRQEPLFEGSRGESCASSRP